jgi:putative hemolysin
LESWLSDPYSWRWLVLGGLVVICAFFATIETSLFALSPLERLRLKESNRPRGELVEGLLARPRRLLVTVLIAVETVSILFSVLATSLAPMGARGQWLALLVCPPIFLGEIIPKSAWLPPPAGGWRPW